MKLSTTVVCCSLEIADSFETVSCCAVWQLLNFWQAPSQILLEVSVRHFPEIKLAHSTTTDCFKTVYCAGIGLLFFATHHPPCTVCCCSALISTSRYRSSSASRIGTWYTSSCITPSIQSSTKYWKGLLASLIWGLMNWSISLHRSSAVSRAWCDGAFYCWKTAMLPIASSGSYINNTSQ